MGAGYQNKRKSGALLLIVGCLLAFMPLIVTGQSYVEQFGQNRIQYRKFDWKFFDTKHFRVYHYDRAGRDLGRYVAEEAENDINVIEKKLGGQFPKRFSIILYNSYDEYLQTNVGLKDESPITGNAKSGTVNLVGDKLVVYFTGQHNDLQHQIRSGMARVVMERMIFGESFKKMVKSALQMNLPQWVTDGYISYLVDGWDAKSNSDWKSLLEARPDAGFYQLAEEYPELAGKAFWKFVSTQYSAGTMKNLLYTMQQKTSINKAMLEKDNLGLKVTKAYDSCIHFYKDVYAADAKQQEMPDSTGGLIALKVPKDNTVIRSIRVSPRGSDVAYVAWKEGMYTVYTQKTAKGGDAAVLLEGGQKDLTEANDPTYPMLAWSASGYKLAILYKKGFQTKLRVYNSLKGRIDNYVIPKNRFDRVLGMAFMEDDDNLVFSAIKKSQTDLYMFAFKGTKMTNITDDVWDETDPVFVSGGSRTGILFLSNRPKPNMDVPLGVNELPTGPMNVFFYNTRTKSRELLQCTSVATGHVTQPIQYGTDNFAYLYDGNGINNKYVVLFARDKHNKDSAYSVPITNYSTSIISQQYNLASGDVADVVQVKDKYRVYFHNLQMPGVNATVKTLQPTTLSQEKAEPQNKSADKRLTYIAGHYVNEEEQEPQPEIKGGNAFQSEFADTTTQPKRRTRNKGNNNINKANADGAASDSSTLAVINDSAYVKMKPSKYRLSFKPDFFSIKLDNSVLFSQYQSIASNGGQYVNPSLGALTTISLNEMMEDYRITAGFQLPINVSGSAYFLQYQNFRHRLDWGVLFLRDQDKETLPVGYVDQNNQLALVQDQLFKTVTNMVESDFSYPLDRVHSIRFHTSIRQDKLVEKATDTLSLSYPLSNTNTYTSLSRLEYVFDNTISPAINILNGTRFKFYGEYMQSLNGPNKSCYNLGLDIRNYQKLYKNLILANRLAYAHSDGNSEVEYLVGGVDNWISPKQAAGASQAPDPNYGFQAMSTPLRGYEQYARTGNNFAVLNTELRLPVLTTFMKKPIQSSLLKNLQLVAFMDIGSAWKGFIPDVGNSGATYSYPTLGSNTGNNNVYVQFTVPAGVALGYGGGLRTSIFGYFIRLDEGWSIDTPKKPVTYFSLGTDF
jgi:hypothetical protein